VGGPFSWNSHVCPLVRPLALKDRFVGGFGLSLE